MKEKSAYFEDGTILTVQGYSLNRRLRLLIRLYQEVESPSLRYWFRPCEAWFNAWRAQNAWYYWDTDSMKVIT